MSELTWQTAHAADGRLVLAWFEEHIPSSRWQRDETLRRAMLEWALGRYVTFHSLDRHLTKYERHVSELPDDVWIKGSSRNHKREPRAVQKRQAVEKIVPKRCASPGCNEFVPTVKNGKRRSPAEYRRLKFCCRECGWETGIKGREFALCYPSSFERPS